MGTSRSVAELEAKLQRMPRDLTKWNDVAANRIGLFAKGKYLEQARADLGGGVRMRNIGKRGVNLGVRYDIDGPAEKKVVKLRPSTGKIGWRILQGGAKEHIITSKYAGGSRKSRAARVTAGQPLQRNGGRGGRAVLKFGGATRRWVKHPGVKPKRTWTTATREIKDPVIEVYSEGARKAFGEAFK